MSSARGATNGFNNRQIIRRITWLAAPGGLIPTALICLLAYFYWQSWFEQPNEAFFRLAVGLGILSLLITWLTSRVTAQRLAASMQRLAEAMGKFATGLWDERAIVRQSDPLVQVAMLFNHIADDYRATYQSLTVRPPDKTPAHNPLIEQIVSQVTSAQMLDHFLSDALMSISRAQTAVYAGIYLLEHDEPAQKRLLNLVHFVKTPDFASAAIAEETRDFFPETPGVRIALDKTGQLDWPLKRAVSTGKSIIQEVAFSKEIMEAAVPLVRNGHVMGVIDLFIPARSSEPSAAPLSYRSLWEVEQTANLVALAIESFKYEQGTALPLSADTTQLEAQATQLYLASGQVAQAASEEEAQKGAWGALEHALNPCAVLLGEPTNPEQLRLSFWSGRTSGADEKPVVFTSASLASTFNAYTPLLIIQVDTDEANHAITATEETREQPGTGLPAALFHLASQLGRQTAAFLPVFRNGQVCALMIVGLPTQEISASANATLEPYRSLLEALVSSLERIQTTAKTQRQLAELQAFWNVSQVISIETDLEQLFSTIHHQLETVLGELRSFAIALYEADAGLIRIPYIIEEGQRMEVTPFSLGEGLTSILIRTGQPLLLSEDVEAQSVALGAKQLGEPAKSWLGAPMLHAGKVIGAIIVQDVLHEGRFNKDDQRLLGALASEVGVVIHNARLLEASRQLSRQERLINEISAKIHRSSDIQTILKTTAVELGTALGAQKAAIRLGVSDEPVGLDFGGGQ